jgi:aminoglycoside phosphotransferase (APT) family kinase protein
VGTGAPAASNGEPLVDRRALARWIDDRFGPADEPLEVERHTQGHSNETFFVRRGEQSWVLRRPPRGAFLPTAHDVLREHRVLSAIADTPVRAPRPVAACSDPSVIGVPFYLMERVRGVVMRDSGPPVPSLTDAARRAVGEELVDALAEVHAIGPRAAGLEGFGRETGYLERQLRRWGGQLDLTEPLTRPLPDLRAAGEWLRANLPASGPATLVHGDYKLDNVAFDPGLGRGAPPALAAIFDWEMATIGDPLADVGWMLSFWPAADEPATFAHDATAPSRLPGFAAREDLLSRYAERSGRSVTMAGLRFYRVLALFKLAILLEGSYARHLAGHTDDPFFETLRTGVPNLASRAVALTTS